MSRPFFHPVRPIGWQRRGFQFGAVRGFFGEGQRIFRRFDLAFRLRFPHGVQYNVLQKLAYAAVLFVLLPLMVLSGLAMSPGMDSALPPLLTLFDGRQSARTVHFVTASALVLFFLVHIVMVLVSGVWNNLRSMLTGRYRIEPAE